MTSLQLGRYEANIGTWLPKLRDSLSVQWHRLLTLQDGTDTLSRKRVTQYNQRRVNVLEERLRGGSLTPRNTKMFATLLYKEPARCNFGSIVY